MGIALLVDSGASMCSRLSPSSSGYKSQSQRSDATISPSPSPSPVAAMTCSHTQVSSQDLASPESNGQTVMWAVTSISSVPPGSIIINPQTNQPYTNADGTIYRFDPDNPPKLFTMENENGGGGGGNLSSNHSFSVNKHEELITNTEPSRTTNSLCKNDSKKQRSQSKMNAANNHHHHHHHHHNNNNNNNTTVPAQVTNTATSPSLPFTPPPPPPPPLQNPPIPQQPQQQQQQQQQPPPPAPPPPQQPQPQQSLVKSSPTVQTCSHNQTAQPYATYVPTSEPYNQGVYPPPVGQPTVMMAPHPTQGQASVQNGGQGDVLYNQNQIYANYAVPVHQGPVPQSGVSVSRCIGHFPRVSVFLEGPPDDRWR